MARAFHVLVTAPKRRDKWHTLEAHNLNDAARLAAIKFPTYQYVMSDATSLNDNLPSVHYNPNRKRK